MVEKTTNHTPSHEEATETQVFKTMPPPEEVEEEVIVLPPRHVAPALNDAELEVYGDLPFDLSLYRRKLLPEE